MLINDEISVDSLSMALWLFVIFPPTARICNTFRSDKTPFFSGIGLRTTDFHFPTSPLAQTSNRRPRLIKLIAACGALDIDDPQPTITVMMADED
jgi:hypothetical protein